MKLDPKQTQAVLDSFERNLEKAIANNESLTWQSFLSNVNDFLNIHTKRNYVGRFNGIMLSLTSAAYGGDTRFAAFGQIKQLGGSVKKGEKGTPLFRPNIRIMKDASTGEESQQLLGFSQFIAFNIQQTDLIEKKIFPKEQPTTAGNQDLAPIDAVDNFTKWIGYDEVVSNGCPYYSPFYDHIGMPPFQAFYYAWKHSESLLHELVHWTGHKTRLDRHPQGWSNTKQDYSKEELVAELGAAFLLNHLGVKPSEEQEKNQTAYLRGWLKPLRDDISILLEAAQDSIAACNYLTKASKKGREERTGKIRVTA